MWLVAEDDAPAAGDLQPAVEALQLSREDVGAAEHFPELGFLAVREQLADAGVDRVDGVGLVFLEQCRVRIAAAVLRERAVCEPDHRGPVAQPFLPWSIFRELVEIVALASDAHPESDARRIAQRPEHRDLVVAEKHGGVGAVSRVPQGADAERTVVDQVAKEDGSPAIRWVGCQRVEEPLEVAMDIAGDQDW